jgi:methyltransferase (TIGR00027 family)
VARTHNDTWDLASSVGVTATMVAAARAMASRAPVPLIDDPFAEPLVAAVGLDVFTRLARGEIDIADIGADNAASADRFANGMAVRTKFFDDFLLGSVGAAGPATPDGTSGIRQVVILASGLDSRAYRLPWPAGTVVYEIDQPQVIEFKTATLAEFGATPTADRRPVAVDLRDDWPAALREAGFDSGQPTAWIAEGLLGYLPPEAQDRLLDNVTSLSTKGSRFATESAANPGELDDDEIRDRMEKMSEQWKSHGFDVNLADLIYLGDRNEASTYLNTHGWETTGRTAGQLFVDYGLQPPVVDPSTFGEMLYADGILK